MKPSPEIATAALALAAQGWRLVPLRPNGKVPIWQGWPERAAPDASHWVTDPEANIGICTGRGFIVLDVDGAAGVASLQALTKLHGELPPTLAVETASGGLHYYLSCTDAVRNSAGKLGAGLDIRGESGQVVCPPSHIDGKTYKWLNANTVAPCPRWLIDMALAAAPVSPAPTSEPVEVEVTDELVEDLRSALASIPADNRGDWIAVGAALRAVGDVGRDLWVGWSATSDTHDPEVDPYIWETIGHDATGPAAIFARAARLGWVNPRSTLARAASIFGNGSTPTTVTGEPIESAFDPCSHVSNGQRIVQHFGDQLLWVTGIGWHVWKERWTPDDLAAKRIAQRLGKVIANEAAALGPWVADAPDYVSRDDREAIQKKRWKWAGQSEQEGHLESSLRLASTMLSCAAGDMDADADLLGLPGGVLDLRTCTMRPYERADRISKAAGCNFDPDATASTWERFIAEVTGGDVELAAYLQRLAGYMLSGHRREHVLPVAYGSGANGKSTFVSTLMALLGDYARMAPEGLLVQPTAQQQSSATAALAGRRLVVVAETGENGRLNEQQAKALSGGDKITACLKYKEPFDFTPTHLLLVMTNHRPRVTGQDEGLWRRLRLIPFTVTVPPERRDQTLPDKLLAELPGVMAWAVRGWQAYQRDGLGLPAAVKAATSEYRSASDEIGAWVEECCHIDPRATTTADDLYASYVSWFLKEGGQGRARSKRDLGLRLAERGFDSERGTGGVRRWRGIKVCNPFGRAASNLQTAAQ